MAKNLPGQVEAGVFLGSSTQKLDSASELL